MKNTKKATNTPKPRQTITLSVKSENRVPKQSTNKSDSRTSTTSGTGPRCMVDVIKHK